MRLLCVSLAVPVQPLVYILRISHFHLTLRQRLLCLQYTIDLVGATLKLVVKGMVAPKKCVHLNVVVNCDNAFGCLYIAEEVVLLSLVQYNNFDIYLIL